jgi:hypothetical protein
VSFTDQINVPLSDLSSVSHFQGGGWARSPVDGAEWFFQLQAQPTDNADVEDLYIHRYSLIGDALEYQDTMVGIGFGHCQTTKVRVSSANNAHLWLGLETYDDDETVGNKPFKVRYLAGEKIKRSHDDVVPIYVSGNYATPIDCPDWTIVLRRPSGDSEIYEWYDEDELCGATEDAPAVPTFKLTVPKEDTYQGACATGPSGAPDSIYRINGAAEDTPQWLMHYRASGSTSQLEMTNIVSGTGGGTLEEPEAVLTIRGRLWVGKQTSPRTDDRILAYLRVSWTPFGLSEIVKAHWVAGSVTPGRHS